MPPMTSSVAVAAKFSCFYTICSTVVACWACILRFSSSNPGGGGLFPYYQKRHYCLLVISKLPHGPRKDLNLRDYLLMVRLRQRVKS